jgi:hypothetical protein
MHIRQTWNSAIGDYEIEIDASKLEEVKALLQIAKEANIVQIQAEAISKHVKELEAFAKIRKLTKEEEEE